MVLIGIHIFTRINMKTFENSQMIQFVCNYELCNSNETFIELKSLIDQYFDLTPMCQALFKNRSIQIEQSTTQQTSSSSVVSLLYLNIAFWFFCISRSISE